MSHTSALHAHPAAATEADRTVRLWHAPCGSGATALALAKGWLQEEFADAGFRLDAADPARHRADVPLGLAGGIREGGNVPAIWARAAGSEDSRLIGIISSDEYQGILVRRDSKIRTLPDLRRKRLGLPLQRAARIDVRRAAAQRAFATALSLGSLQRGEANFVHFEAPASARATGIGIADAELPAPTSLAVRALACGYVDAVFVRGAAGYAAAQDPSLRQLINLNSLDNPLLRANHATLRPITADRSLLERHPELVARYLAVLLRAARWAGRHPREARQLGQEGNSTGSEARLAQEPDWQAGLLPRLDRAAIAGLEVQKQFLRDWAWLRSDFDLQDWIDPGPLAQAQALAARPADIHHISPQLATRADKQGAIA